jgi:hypothetical protein
MFFYESHQKSDGILRGSLVKYVNVLGKRAGQASEPIKILHILPSTTDYTSKVEDIETKQIVL